MRFTPVNPTAAQEVGPYGKTSVINLKFCHKAGGETATWTYAGHGGFFQRVILPFRACRRLWRQASAVPRGGRRFRGGQFIPPTE